MSAVSINALAKAERFADFLAEHLGATLDLAQLDQITMWGDVEWARVAEWMNDLNGTTETSPQTSRSIIVRSLRNRLTTPADPFAGIPTAVVH